VIGPVGPTGPAGADGAQGPAGVSAGITKAAHAVFMTIDGSLVSGQAIDHIDFIASYQYSGGGYVQYGVWFTDQYFPAVNGRPSCVGTLNELVLTELLDPSVSRMVNISGLDTGWCAPDWDCYRWARVMIKWTGTYPPFAEDKDHMVSILCVQ
jgi:hypothetical protein